MSYSPRQHELKIAFYGDDFTGSTDALECLTRAGLRTALFLEPPTVEQLATLPTLDALGVAGRTRSLPTREIEAEIRPILTALRDLGPRHVHYKVCSTFDSSPDVGSIGRVIDVAAEIFSAPFVPLVVGVPSLGRWCAFGNLFAQVGIGSDGSVCRLDRHPAMQNHPITPADESDLRRHLAKQTDKTIALVDFRLYDMPIEELATVHAGRERQQAEVVLFDVLTDHHLCTIGALLDLFAERHAPFFSVGSSGIETGLAAHWGEKGLYHAPPSWDNIYAAGPVLVVSGSCSPVTSGQIEHALSNGFAAVPLDAAQLFCESGRALVVERAIDEAVRQLHEHRSVVVYTSRNGKGSQFESGARIRTAEAIGCALGQVVVACATRTGIRRACVVGGDTATYAAREMGIESLEMSAPLTRGAPLCRVTSNLSHVNGLEIAFKGGQVGRPDFFLSLAAIKS